MSLIAELKRRNVIRVAVGYIVVAWLVVQVVETIFPAFGFGDEAVRLVVIAFAVGFVPVVVLAWVFEWAPQGIRKDEGVERQGPAIAAGAKRWDRIVMVILAAAVAFFIVENILEQPDEVEPAVVVVPFENMSSDPEQAYFANGVSESVHASLARIPAIIVSAWPTARALTREGLAPMEIAEKLEAPNLLEGTVQKSGNRVRVTARLIAVASKTTLWSQTYDRTLDDIFAIQDEIAADVVSNLQVELLGEVPKAQRTNPETHLLTIQAWALLHAAGPEADLGPSAKAALALLDEALALDPNYVQALLAKSLADAHLRIAGVITRQEEQRRWQDIKTRVGEIDPDDGLLNAYLAWESVFDYRDFEQANEYLQLALRHGRNDMEALRMLEAVARRTGNFDAAVAIGRRRTAIDPTCQRCFWQFSEGLFYAGLFEQAIEAKKRFQLITLGAGGFSHHAQALLLLGDYEAAVEVVRSREGVAADSQGVAIMAMAAWSMHDMSSFEKYVEELKQSESAHQIQLVATVYSWAGDADQAFAWIDKAIEAGSNMHWHLFLPIWENLRDDPRWKELRERLSWTDEQLAALDFSL